MKFSKIFRILPVFSMIFCTGCTTHTKSNVEDYLDILKEARDEKDFHTELYICPETIENLEIRSFVYSCRWDLFTNSFLFYIVLDFEEESFATELQRISEVKSVFKDGQTKSILSYPEHNMFVTVKQNARFEYVIYNETKLEIAYVSNQIFDWDEIPVAEEYIIPDITIPSEVDDGENMYNIYYWYEEDVGLYVE